MIKLNCKEQLLPSFPSISGSESDSAEESVVGNVNKFSVVAPGYAGRPKRGHLMFDACFESGKYQFYSLTPGRGGCNLELVIFKLISTYQG